ncbi:MAG: hypothetical protein JRD68_03715 [Deltaproteobacteria bacterium]|nr:hypothetical protein [Deltaproteobacteria bacterium]
MKYRELVQKRHEKSIIDQFLSWYNIKQGTEFEVVRRPDPPDAIAQDNSNIIWIEHTDIYRSAEEAKEERSFATPGETPYERQERPIRSPDKRIALSFVRNLNKKLSKESYYRNFKALGPGLLVLTERDPLFSQSTWDCILAEIDSYCFANDKGYFQSVFLGYRSKGGLSFLEVEYH